MRLTCLRLHSPGEAIAPDDSQFVKPPGNTFLLVMGFELKRNNRAFDMNHAGAARDALAGWRGCEMLNVDVLSHGALARFQERQHGLTGSVLQKPDQPRCTQHGRHPISSEVDGMFLFDDEFQLPDGADPGR